MSDDVLKLGMLDPERLTAEDLRYLHAVYASQVSHTDELFGLLIDGLGDLGLLDDAIVLTGSDHGESLAQRTNYMYHGCSYYNPALATSWSIWAPGRLPAQELPGWSSSVDLAPTLLDLAGLEFRASDFDGISLAESLRLGTPPSHNLFFERSTKTAGIVAGDHKYVLNPEGDYGACNPYNTVEGAGHLYANEEVELFDMGDDPLEQSNLAGLGLSEESAMHEDLCAWLTGSTWVNQAQDVDNPLLEACR